MFTNGTFCKDYNFEDVGSNAIVRDVKTCDNSDWMASLGWGSKSDTKELSVLKNESSLDFQFPSISKDAAIGFQLQIPPSHYWGETYCTENNFGLFARYAKDGSLGETFNGTDTLVLAKGKSLRLSSSDGMKNIEFKFVETDIYLLDCHIFSQSRCVMLK